MPLGDEKHKLIYQEMVNILGANYFSDVPAVLHSIKAYFANCRVGFLNCFFDCIPQASYPKDSSSGSYKRRCALATLRQTFCSCVKYYYIF